MFYKVYGITDVGPVRKRNEDGFVWNRKHINNGYFESEGTPPFHVLVADGMGGENAGDVASSLVLQSFVNREQFIKDEEELRNLVENEIQQKLLSHMETNPQLRGMGTTLAGIACTDEKFFIFHIGDSRIYRYRDGFLKQLTKDHSLVESLYESGRITYEEKQNHPQKHILLRSLGGKEAKIDIFSFPSLPAEGDLFFLCSDGITDLISNDEIEEILSENLNLQDSAHRLIELAKKRGGYDNMTVVLVKCIGEVRDKE